MAANRTAQGSSLSNQEILTEGTVAILNALYVEMATLLADGKSLYKRTDKTRAKDYTVAQLLKRVRKAHAASTSGTTPA